MIFLYIALGIIGLLLVVILIKAATFKPTKLKEIVKEEMEIEKEKSLEKFSGLISCKTIATFKNKNTDYAPFDKFLGLLKQYYPSVYEKAELVDTNEEYHHLIKIKGNDSSTATLLMAHMDVVPCEGKWDKDPFSGEVSDGYIHGRGTIDTKGTLVSIMEAMNELLEEGFTPKNDVYLIFGADEEVYGTSAQHRTKYFVDNNIKINFVLDEGGAIVEKVFPGVNKLAAVIGTIEKGTCYFKISVKSSGGHSSSPKKDGVNIKLAKALLKLEKHGFKPTINGTVKEMLDIMGRESSFVYKLIFGNMWLFKGLVKKLFVMLDGEPRALVSTTMAFTTLEGAKVDNALPTISSAGINARLLNHTIEEVQNHIQKVVGKDIEVTLVNGFEASKESSSKNEQFNLIKDAIHETYSNDIVVTPYVMLGSADARHYSKITDNVYRFTPMILSKQDRAGIHGINEKLSIENYYKCIEFYKRLIKKI